ncbi:hypothetical protein I4U23_022769 [Adineta vaga]|nr:hypothetical protein I4U23_022769 [Adineta vaga]
MEQTFVPFSPENNNLETFSLVWLVKSINETEKNMDIQQQFRALINYLKIFQDDNECENYIRSLPKDDRIVLIVNNQIGEELVSRIHHLRQVFAVYIYCTCEKTNQQWTKTFSKIKNAGMQLDKFVNEIQFDQERRIRYKIDEPFLVNIFNTNNSQDLSTTELNGQFVYSHLLVDCLLRMESNSNDKNELIEVCERIIMEICYN